MIRVKFITIGLIFFLSIVNGEVQQKILLKGNNNTVIQIINKGLSDKAINRITKPLKDKIFMLENKLKRTDNIEKKYTLLNQIKKTKKTLEQKIREIKSLNILIKNSKTKVIKEATQIYEESGIDATLIYLEKIEFKTIENNIEKNIKIKAKEYKFKAKILQLANRYEEANDAYREVLDYDRSHKNLFEYGFFLQSQNYFDEAIKIYKILYVETIDVLKSTTEVDSLVSNLEIFNTQNKPITNKYKNQFSKRFSTKKEKSKKKKLLKTYLDRVKILNNLVLLYKKTNQLDKAKEKNNELKKIVEQLNRRNYEIEK